MNVIEQTVVYLGFLFSGFISPLLNFIRLDGVGAGLALIIVLAGVTVAIWAFVQFVIDFRRIAKAREILAKAGTEDLFAENYNELSQDLCLIPVIGSAWEEFCESLVPPSRRQDGGFVPAGNTVRPGSFFNLYDLDIGPDFLKVWPNVFVGIGLSLTFLGLISALAEATSVMQQAVGDANKIQQAVQGLLNVASAKFYASLFALVVSVILTLLLRGITQVLESQLRRLNAEIEGSVRLITSESLQLQSNIILKEQLVQLTTFNTDLAIKIGENITSALQPVLNQISSSNEKMTREQTEAMEKMGREVSDSISGSTQEAMEKVATKLEEVSEKLGSLGDILASSLSGFDEELKAAVSGLSLAVKDILGTVGTELEISLSKLGPQLEANLSGITKSLSGLQQEMNRQAEQGAEDIKAAVDEATKEAANAISSSGSQLSEAFRASTEDLVEHLNGMTSQLKQLEDGLLDLPEKLGLVSKELDLSSASIGDASQKFTSASDGIRRVVEPLAEFAMSNKQAIELIAKELSATTSELSTIAENLETSVSKLSEGVLSRISEIDGGEEALANYLGAINESTERVLQSLSTYVTQTDEGFRAAIGTLEGAIEEFEAVVTKIGADK